MGYYISSTCPTDTGYETDTTLVQNALGTLKAQIKDGSYVSYWLTSRYNFNNYYMRHNVRFITPIGKIDHEYMFNVTGSGTIPRWQSFAIRPIITLKSDIQIISGDGKSVESAFQID